MNEKRKEETIEFKEIYDFLFKINQQQYYNKFIEEGFEDSELLKTIEENDLKEMGLKKAHIRKTLNAIKEMKEKVKNKNELKEQKDVEINDKEKKEKVVSNSIVDNTIPQNEKINNEKQQSNSHIGAQEQCIEGNKEIVEYNIYNSFHSIFIGTNNYQNLDHLSGASFDAIEMKEMFEKMGFETLEPLLNENATKIGIENKIDELRIKLLGKNEEEKKINSESIVVFYFSGHGFEEKEGQQITHHLCPHDFDENKLSETSINLQTLKNHFSSFNCKHVLFILDCCFSGGIFEEQNKLNIQISNSNQNSILMNSFQKGIWAITAGGKEEVKEKTIEGRMRGVFTFYFIKSLNSNQNYKIEKDESEEEKDEKDESLFCEEFQIKLKNKNNDKSRQNIKIIYPNEIIEWIRREMIKNEIIENIPKCGSLNSSVLNSKNSNLIGIPILGRTIKDFKIKTTKIEIENSQKIAKEEIEELQKFNPMQQQHDIQSTKEQLEKQKILYEELEKQKYKDYNKLHAIEEEIMISLAQIRKKETSKSVTTIVDVDEKTGKVSPNEIGIQSFSDCTKQNLIVNSYGKQGIGKSTMLRTLCLIAGENVDFKLHKKNTIKHCTKDIDSFCLEDKELLLIDTKGTGVDSNKGRGDINVTKVVFAVSNVHIYCCKDNIFDYDIDAIERIANLVLSNSIQGKPILFVVLRTTDIEQSVSEIFNERLEGNKLKKTIELAFSEVHCFQVEEAAHKGFLSQDYFSPDLVPSYFNPLKSIFAKLLDIKKMFLKEKLIRMDDLGKLITIACVNANNENESRESLQNCWNQLKLERAEHTRELLEEQLRKQDEEKKKVEEEKRIQEEELINRRAEQAQRDKEYKERVWKKEHPSNEFAKIVVKTKKLFKKWSK